MTNATDISRPLTPALDRGPALSAAPLMISREGERALHRELDELLEKRDRELPRRLQRAREFGESTGNDDYLQIMEEEAINTARIQRIRAILAAAQVVDPSDDHGVAGLGSIVTLKASGKLLERRLLGAHEPVGDDGVSAASPIGQAVLGCRAGETVNVELPNGKRTSLEIVAVRAPGRERLELAAA